MTENLSSPHTGESAPAVTDERIEMLELKMMDLENTVHELNEVILRQYRDIEQLQMQQSELLNRMANTAQTGPTPSMADELPPHY